MGSMSNIAYLCEHNKRDELIEEVSDCADALGRTAEEIVNGSSSDIFNLLDMVFGGTVLGPVLWNVFFNGIHAAAVSTGCIESRFAEDLGTYKTFNGCSSNEALIEN